MRTSERKLGPWPKGLDNVSRYGDVDKATKRSVNAFVDRSGSEVLAVRMNPSPSTDRFRHGPIRVDASGAIFYRGAATGLVASPPYFADSSDSDTHLLSASDGLFIGQGPVFSRALTTRPFLVPSQPPAPTDTPIQVVVQHKEGSVSEPVALGGDLRVRSSVDGTLYMTRQGGGDFYRVGPVTAGVEVELPASPSGELLPHADLDLKPMFYTGTPCTIGRNRAFYAAGTMIFFSEPFRYSVWRVNNLIPVGTKVLMVAALGELLFVGTDQGVAVVKNIGTEQVSFEKVASSPVLSYSFCRVPGSVVGQELDLVAWATQDGIQLGLPDGTVATMAAGRFRATAPHNGVLTFVDNVFYYIPRG